MTTSRRSSTISAAFSLFVAVSLCAGCDIPAPAGQEEAVEQSTHALTASPTASKDVSSATNAPTGSINLGGTVLSSAVVDSVHCPERLPGNGDGNLVGGMCLYPMPPGGCSELGSDCSPTQDFNPQCRCSQKTLPGGKGSGTVEFLPAS